MLVCALGTALFRRKRVSWCASKSLFQLESLDASDSDPSHADVLTQLRKVNWINGELQRVAEGVARETSETDIGSILSQCGYLALLNSVTMEDVERFILGVDP